MLHHLRSTSTSASGRSPALPEDSVEGDEESAKAIAVSDQRTIYLVNMFIANTVEFLNSFVALCDDKLALLHRNFDMQGLMQFHINLVVRMLAGVLKELVNFVRE